MDNNENQKLDEQVLNEDNQTEVAQNQESVANEGNKEKTFTLTESQLMERVNRIAKNKGNETKSENTSLKAEVDNLKQEISNYKKKLAFADYKFKDDEVKEYVDYKVSKMTNEEKDFKTALAEYMAGAGKAFIAEEKEENKNTDPDVSKVNNVGSSNNSSSLADAIRKGAGL